MSNAKEITKEDFEAWKARQELEYASGYVYRGQYRHRVSMMVSFSGTFTVTSANEVMYTGSSFENARDAYQSEFSG